MEGGEFDDLEGAGEPIADLGDAYDPGWWAKAWARRELKDPRQKALEDHVQDELQALSGTLDETEVRRRLQDLNRLLGSHPAGAAVEPIEVEEAIVGWRRHGALPPA